MAPKLLMALLTSLGGVTASQTVLRPQTQSASVTLGSSWGSLGPFQVGTREFPLLHPNSPLLPFDLHFSNLSWDSPEVDRITSTLYPGGKAIWKTFDSSPQGEVIVSYPEINWNFLRQSGGGWSALQFYTLLRTSLVVSAPADISKVTILVNLVGGADFYLVPRSVYPPRQYDQLETYKGDFYSFSAGLNNSLVWGHSIQVPPGEYTIVVRTVYDVRSGGGAWDDNIPKIHFQLLADVLKHRGFSIIEGSQIVPDILDGWLMGEGVGVALRWNDNELGHIENVEVLEPAGFHGSLVDGPLLFQPSQIRQVSIRLSQEMSLSSLGPEVPITIALSPSDTRLTLTLKILGQNASSFAITHIPPGQPLSVAVAIPPRDFETLHSNSILYLHGAGASPLADDIRTSFPTQNAGWVVLPMGRTEWGLDWHGPSITEARHAGKEAVKFLNKAYAKMRGFKLEEAEEEKIIVVGHSNGGQGTWYFVERWPDEVEASIIASGYVKIEEYIPYHLGSARLFEDPALTTVLMSSLLQYDNGLHATNTYGIPILHRHGGEDDNVPNSHGRAMSQALQTWSSNLTASKYEEVEGAPHFWSTVFKTPSVQEFLKSVTSSRDTSVKTDSWSFTITTANVDEGGTKFGWKVQAVNIRGHLARLVVRVEGSVVWLDGWNVKTVSFCYKLWPGKLTKVYLRGTLFDLNEGSEKITFDFETGKEIEGTLIYRRSGPVDQILSSNGPLDIRYVNEERDKSAALRVAHDYWVTLRGDATVQKWTGQNDLTNSSDTGNLVIIDEAGIASVEVGADSNTFVVGSKRFDRRDFGLISLIPHPLNPKRLALKMEGRLEGVEPLFPTRTGVTIPEFAVVGPTFWGDRRVVAAGWYNDDWEVEYRSSYL